MYRITYEAYPEYKNIVATSDAERTTMMETARIEIGIEKGIIVQEATWETQNPLNSVDYVAKITYHKAVLK